MCSSRAPEVATAVVLLDHGSRIAASNSDLEDLAAHLARATGERFVCVEAAHMELAEPTLADAFARCVARGARRVVVVLYFLSPGAHTTRDIPALAAAAAAEHGGVEYVVSDPLGSSEAVPELLLSLVESALGRF